MELLFHMAIGRHVNILTRLNLLKSIQLPFFVTIFSAPEAGGEEVGTMAF